MPRILITGSSDGLGSAVANRLIASGHTVVLHARNAQRAADASTACPGAEAVLTGDLSSMASTKALAEQANQLAPFDAIIHNAGLFRGPFRPTPDGLPALAAVNTLAPYILAALVRRPQRLVFLSSDLHRSASSDLSDVLWTRRGEPAWNHDEAYAASKLHNIMFAKAFARRWPDVLCNALDPGWVATKMGGSQASDSIDAAVDMYVLLAVGDVRVSGRYFQTGGQEGVPLPVADDEKKQEELLEICARVTGVHV